MVDAETRVVSLYNKIARTNGLLGVFRVVVKTGYAYRTAPYHGYTSRSTSFDGSKARLFKEAENTKGVYLIGVYDARIQLQHLHDDIMFAEKDPAKK